MLRTGAPVFTTILILLFAGDLAALELEDCRISAGPAFPGIKARCGTMLRPENPADPDSPGIELAVAVVPALSLEPEPDPLVPLAGGPGGSAIEFYSAWSHAFEYVRRNRDILLVDQRGTGGSSRMSCDFGEDVVEGQYSTEQILDLTLECLESLPHDPRYFTTSIAVADLEAVRQALGYPLLNLYGVSYGTRVAQHFARRHPESTRSIVLDGVVPPQLPLGPEIATEAQAALDNILQRCSEDAICNARFPNIRQAFLDVHAQLEAEAVVVDLTDPATGRRQLVDFGTEQLAGAIRLLAYNANTIAIMPLLIHEASNGNFVPLAAQFQMIAASMAEALAMGMHNAVMCSEDVPFYDHDTIDVDALKASYIGIMQLDAIEAMCSVWPAGPVDPGLREPLATDLPVLLLSGEVDPITPPEYAELAMIDLGQAQHLTGILQGHGQAGIGCTPRLIGQFVESPGRLSDDDVSCLHRSFVMPFFLDFSGPAP